MIHRDALREYTRGSLWVLPTLCVLIALVAGILLSLVDVGPTSPLAFQGTAEDARSLLSAITSTMVTVIALLLGLAVVALQLSSTQFSPRLLRNFLRDRPNQLVLGVFVGTFAYSAAGLFTVGVSEGQRSDQFPRLRSPWRWYCCSSAWRCWSISPTTSRTQSRSTTSCAWSSTPPSR